jgi:hypothetical protein
VVLSLLPVPLVMQINNGKHWLRLELSLVLLGSMCSYGRMGSFFQSILTGFQRLANVDVMKPQKWSDLLYVIGPSAISCGVGVQILTIMRSQRGFTVEDGWSKFIK